MGWGLWASATRTLVSMGNLKAVEVGEQLAVPSSKSEYGDLFRSVQLVDAVVVRLDLQSLPPSGLEVASKDCLRFSEGHWMGSLGELAACLGESVRFFVAHDTTVRGYPLQNECGSRVEGLEFPSDVL